MGADFNKKAYEEIYKHGTWEQTADRYEEQFAAKLARQKNCADFTIQTDFRPAMLRGFHRKSPFMH